MTQVAYRTRTTGGFKLTLAGMAAAALTVLGMSPVHAAESQLGPDSIIGFENPDEESSTYNYDQWHIGNSENPDLSADDSLVFNECSITMLEPVDDRSITQVLKGFPIDARPTSLADIRSMIESMSIDIAQGNVDLQIPIFWHTPGDPTFFTTIRNSAAFSTPGVHGLASGTAMTDSADGINLSLEEMFEELELAAADGATFELLGLGLSGTEGAEINSFSFGGNTYQFGTGDCMQSTGGSGEVDDNDDAPSAPKRPVRIDTGV